LSEEREWWVVPRSGGWCQGVVADAEEARKEEWRENRHSVVS